MNYIKKFVVNWNNTYPIDYWYRRKFNIAFNSQEHKQLSFIDMYSQWIEEKIKEKVLREREKEKELKNRYKENGFLNPRDIQIDESIYDSLDLSAFNDPEDVKEDSF